MGSGRFSYANASWRNGTKRWRGTLPIAAMTASPNFGRPVSPPVSRAIAAISATMRARAPARASCAGAPGASVSPITSRAGRRKPGTRSPGSSDHQARQPIRIGEEVRAGTAIGDAPAVEHQRVLRHLERELGVLLDQDDGQGV